MKKLIALLLCLCLALALFAGCGQTKVEPYDSEAAAEEPVEETAEEPADEPADEPAEESAGESAAEEPASAADAEAELNAGEPGGEAAEETAPAAGIGLGGTGYETYPADEVVGTVNDTEVPWVEYYYWLSYYTSISQELSSMLGLEIGGWDSNELFALYYAAAQYGLLSVDLSYYGLTEENTNAEIVTKLAQTNVIQYHVIQSELSAQGVTLSEEDEAAIQSVVEQNADGIEGVGDGDGVATEEELAAFREYLETEMSMNLDFFNFMNSVSLLEGNGFRSMYGEGGENYSDEDAVAFANENGLMAAKHILLLTIDPQTGEALSEEEAAAKRTKAEELSEQLHGQADKEAMAALFDELTAENTEDTGYAAYPDGYLFTTGEMVEEFENAVKALDEDYGLSEIVESAYGYHIILRIPVDPDGVIESVGATVRNVAAAEAFYAQEEEWVQTADVQWNEGFENPDLAAIFG